MDPAHPTAMCAVHDGVPSVGTCSHCGNYGCGECLGTMDGEVICRTCVEEGRVSEQQLCAWERRAELGLFAALGQTMMELTLHPVSFFESLHPTERIKDAIILLLIVLIPAGFVAAGINYGSQAVFPQDPQPVIDLLGEDHVVTQMYLRSIEPSILRSGFQALTFPLQSLLWATVAALLIHLGLMVVGGNEHGLKGTLKATYYGWCILAWGVIPICGQLVAGLWLYVLLILGVIGIHRTAGWKGAIAVLWPLAVTIFCVCAGAVVFGFVAAGLMSGSGY